MIPAGKRLDLSGVLSGAPPAELHLYLEPLDAPAGCGAVLFRLAASARTTEASDFDPRCNGLYQLSGTGDAMEGAYPATVLLAGAGQRARAQRMLDEAAGVTAQWQSAGEDERRTFLRLTLSAIQQSLRSPQ